MAAVRVALHAALDPLASGGVQTNLVSLALGLKRRAGTVAATMLSPSALVDRWRAVAAPEIAVAAWRHVFPWYRGVADDLQSAQKHIAALASPLQEVKRRDLEIAAIGADALHFPYQVAFDSELPTIYEPWDLQHTALPDLFTPGERAWRSALYGRACRRATCIVTATEATKRDVCAQFDIEPENVVVIYRDARPLPAPMSADAVVALRRRLGIGGDYVFYPAATYAHKNHALLIEAAALLRDRYGLRIQFVCSGKRQDSTWADLSGRLRRWDLADTFKFVGVVSDDDLAALYRGARLVAFPSLFEGLGLPLLEAMQAGAPLAAARTSCIPEVVGDAAALFDPLDPDDAAAQIARLWQDASERARLSRLGASRRLDFGWDQAARAFEDVYRRAAGRPI